MSGLQLVTLGVALADADHKVREEGGNNRGARIQDYLRNTEPPINVAAPWCAAAVQYWADVAARHLGVDNPLDAIRHEALVQSYHDALAPQGLVNPDMVEPGDLALFRFPNGPDRWNHIGMVVQRPNDSGIFWSVEGNTGDVDQRDGDGVYVKPREVDPGYPVCFLRWHVAGNWEL